MVGTSSQCCLLPKIYEKTIKCDQVHYHDGKPFDCFDHKSGGFLQTTWQKQCWTFRKLGFLAKTYGKIIPCSGLQKPEQPLMLLTHYPAARWINNIRNYRILATDPSFFSGQNQTITVILAILTNIRGNSIQFNLYNE